MTSTIKVNNVQNQCGQNIINENSNTITIGASGDTIALASGASQTGFGRTGTVDWVTTIQTSTPFTAVSGKGYFINTTSGAITMNLPSSPSVGDIVSFKDYARTFQNNNLTVGRGGSNMDGTASDSVFSTEGLSATLIYMDATKGWSLINDDATTKGGAAYIAATGGTVTTVCTNFKVHTFTGPGTFCVSNAGNAGGSNTVDYLVIAGGGSSSQGYNSYNGGGGGAGGYRFSNGTASGCYSAGPSPLGASALPVTATAFPITVGAGGARVPGCGEQPGLVGANSIFSTITSTGGGAGRNTYPSIPSGPDSANGGSGGGGSAPWPSVGSSNTPVPGGAGNSPPTTPSQGNTGGTTPTNNNAGGGGGGAGAVGGDAPGANTGGAGGAGLASSITGSPVTRGGGGGGAGSTGPGAGGSGGGGAGGIIPNTSGVAGTVNTGGGAGGGAGKSPPGSVTSYNAAGGSGIVIIRYRFQ